MTRKTARTIPRRGGVWLVLCRDLSDVVRIGGETHVRAGMVLDMDTGLVRGAAAAATEFQAVAQAIEMGLTKPGKGLVPGQPDEVLCALELEALLIDVVSSLIGGGRLPAIRVIEPSAEAEDIFDSFVGHLSGRSQPTALPSPSDLEVLYGRAFEFYRAAPWTRWDDGIVMALETSIEDTDGGWAVVVMGNSGIQHGLVLYPAGHIPTGLDDWEPGLSVAMPSGTLSLLLDPPSDLPSDLRDKAIRYGWPADADLMPAVLRFGKEGGGDPGERDAELLAVALAAVTTHDARGLVAVGTARSGHQGRDRARKRAYGEILHLARAARAGIRRSQSPCPRSWLRPHPTRDARSARPPALGICDRTTRRSAHSPALPPWGTSTGRNGGAAPGDSAQAQEGRIHRRPNSRARRLRRYARSHRRGPGDIRAGWRQRCATSDGCTRRQSQHVGLPPTNESNQGAPCRDGGRRGDQQGRRHRLRSLRMPPAATERSATQRQAPQAVDASQVGSSSGCWLQLRPQL